MKLNSDKGELIKTWRSRGYKVKLYYRGIENLGYEFFFKGKLIFEGQDYRPSPMFPGIESIDSVYGLLGFLCLKPGDTDEDFFKDYTPEQMKFAMEQGDDLSIMVNNFEEKRSHYKKMKSTW
jgi:hypothetical protein